MNTAQIMTSVLVSSVVIINNAMIVCVCFVLMEQYYNIYFIYANICFNLFHVITGIAGQTGHAALDLFFTLRWG